MRYFDNFPRPAALTFDCYPFGFINIVKCPRNVTDDSVTVIFNIFNNNNNNNGTFTKYAYFTTFCRRNSVLKTKEL